VQKTILDFAVTGSSSKYDLKHLKLLIPTFVSVNSVTQKRKSMNRGDRRGSSRSFSIVY